MAMLKQTAVKGYYDWGSLEKAAEATGPILFSCCQNCKRFIKRRRRRQMPYSMSQVTEGK